MVHPEIERILRRYRYFAAWAFGLSHSDEEMREACKEVTEHCHRQIQEFLDDPKWHKDRGVMKDAAEALRIMNGDMTWLSEGLAKHDFFGKCQ